MGLTVEAIFWRYCGDEFEDFMLYHRRRTTITLAAHAAAVLGYLAALAVMYPDCWSIISAGPFGSHPTLTEQYSCVAWCVACGGALGALLTAGSWTVSWEAPWLPRCLRHPMLNDLAVYPGSPAAVAISVSRQFRDLSKVTLRLGGGRVILTDSWILVPTAYRLRFAHQSGVDLSVISARDLRTSDATDIEQILSIKVTSLLQRSQPFVIRLHATDFNVAEEKISAPVRNMQGIAIRASLSDQFMTVFESAVSGNTPYRLPPVSQ